MAGIIDYKRFPFGDEPGVAPLISGDGARAYYRLGFLYAAQDAATLLVERRGENASAMPILFLYRHYIELALKDVVAAAGAFAIELSDEKFGHQLRPLWAEASRVFDNYRREKSEVDEAVAELVELDQRADAFRYATTAANQPHFEKIGAVDIPALIEKLGSVAAVVEKLLDQMEQDEAEMNAEIKRLMEKDPY